MNDTESVHARVVRVVHVPLSMEGAIETALCCGTSDARELVEYSHDRAVRASIVANAPGLAMSLAEFRILFGAETKPRHAKPAAAALLAYEESEEATGLRKQLEMALTQTLAEEAQFARWQSARTRVAAGVAMHRKDDYQEALEAVLGEVVRADLRRLDDLRDTVVEEQGVDIMLVSRAISALSQCA